MSDQNREHRPLLCDDNSDEEFHVRSNKFQRRNRISFCNGRARIHAKGATTLIARWPDNYCSTTLAYWWFGLIMFAVTIFLVYNCIQIYGLIPNPTFRQPDNHRTFNNFKFKAQVSNPVDVFMHLIVKNDTIIYLNKYLQHANILVKQYPSFNFKFLVLTNDTTQDIFDFNDVQKNQIALNTLWTDKINNRQRNKQYNISVEFLSLTNFLNASPIKKYWRRLPDYFMDFIVRSISIWDRGGIAFTPLILTSHSSNNEYMKNIQILLQKYERTSQNIRKIKTTTERSAKVNKRPNNIRDIINALEENNNTSEIDLNVADNNLIAFGVNTEDTVQSKLNLTNTGTSQNDIASYESKIKLNEKPYFFKPLNNTISVDDTLPLFLKYLFKTSHKNESTTYGPDLNNSKETQNTSILLDIMNFEQDKPIPLDKFKTNSSKQHDKLGISKSKGFENDQELTIDIKGNIIASQTACHAFLGTVFSNIIHHIEEKTITDFIITELSLFCNGLLSSCVGINVILV